MKLWFRNTIRILFVVGAITLPIFTVLYHPTTSTTSTTFATSIEGQDVAIVGQLIRLKAQGEDVEWRVLPETEDYQVFGEHNQDMVVSFREAGDYTIIAAIITPDLELEIETLKIAVTGSNAIPDKPIDNTTPDDISSQISKWSVEVDLPKDVAEDLAKDFELVANEIDRGDILTPDGVVARTTNLIAQLPLEPYQSLLENIQQLLTNKADNNSLVTQQDHSKVWRSIAKGFRSYQYMHPAILSGIQ